MDIITGNVGWIEVICGPMFSGKSEELIRRLRRAMIARKRVEVFKPTIDNRYSSDEIVSHGDLRMKSEVVSSAEEITARIDWRSEVVGIDESNFMGPQLVEVAQRLADSGKQVIIAGLDTDYLGRPFPPMPDLLAHAESITKTLAICVRCGNPAKHTQRLRGSDCEPTPCQFPAAPGTVSTTAPPRPPSQSHPAPPPVRCRTKPR